MRSTRGQATIDYVALIAVLATVFSAALALVAVGAPGIVNAVAGQFRHALCLVGGASCPDPRSRPCTVASTRETHHESVTIVFVRLDDDRYVLREELSDGTVRLTVGRTGGAGVEAGIGGHASVTVKGRTVGLDDEARGNVQALFGRGQVYVARDRREADAFMRAIRDGRRPAAAREDMYDGGIRSAGTLGIGGPLVGASLKGLAARTIGMRRDKRTGETTFVLNAGSSGSGAVNIALGGPSGTAGGETTFGLTLDRNHRPIGLSVASAGTLAGGVLPPGLEQALAVGAVAQGMRPGGSVAGWATRAGGRRWELGARLDLRDPLVAAAWKDFRDHPTSGDAISVLGEAIRDRSALDLRVYGTKGRSSGASAGVSLGVRIGGELENSTERATLLAASSRPAGGLWEPRLDCVST